MILRPDDLLAALRRGELRIAYQGQWDLDASWDGAFRDARPVALEALSRWNHPIAGDVPPEEFVALAEQGGFLDRLDLDVLTRATAQIASWRSGRRAVGLSVNAAPSHFSASYAESAIRIADALRLDPATLTIEITETPPPQFTDSMRGSLESLRMAGIGVSVDDYGASDTTLDMLKRLPIDEVKLDRSLVQRDDADADEMVDGVVTAARDHGWRVVAEGIETTADLERSVRRGCHRGQGFLWGLPAAATVMEEKLG
jgi:EAL domain-containing protein (putative c-di-GMP-specific phosphodiesterase class I)